MERMERIIIKIIIVQLVILVIVQALLTQEKISYYMSKMVYYEGVLKQEHSQVVETSK